jgi:hypothetical protein
MNNHNKKSDGKRCSRCWRNKLKHTNKTVKKFVKKEDSKMSESELKEKYDITKTYDPKWAIK